MWSSCVSFLPRSILFKIPHPYLWFIFTEKVLPLVTLSLISCIAWKKCKRDLRFHHQIMVQTALLWEACLTPNLVKWSIQRHTWGKKFLVWQAKNDSPHMHTVSTLVDVWYYPDDHYYKCDPICNLTNGACDIYIYIYIYVCVLNHWLAVWVAPVAGTVVDDGSEE